MNKEPLIYIAVGICIGAVLTVFVRLPSATDMLRGFSSGQINQLTVEQLDSYCFQLSDDKLMTIIKDRELP